MYAYCKKTFDDDQGCRPVSVLVIGRLSNNCYVIADSDQADASVMVVDPAGDVDAILDVVGKRSLCCIFLTHHHNDHVGGLAELVQRTGASVVASAVDAQKIEQFQPGFFGQDDNVEAVHVDLKLNDGDTLSVGTMAFRAILTPGHTKGGLCLYLKQGDLPGILFSGDVLFKGTTGRIDLPGGNEKEMRQSLRNKLSKLPDETIVYPGHGRFTTIGAEREPILERY